MSITRTSSALTFTQRDINTGQGVYVIVKPAHVVTSIKQSSVLKGRPFPALL